jgi:AraC-like DNA-binding protein
LTGLPRRKQVPVEPQKEESRPLENGRRVSYPKTREYHAAKGRPADSTSVPALIHQQPQEQVRQRLTGSLARLFTELTGLRYQTSWAPPSSLAWNAERVIVDSELCSKLTGGRASARRYCEHCVWTHLALTLQSPAQGHRFACAYGVRNFWMPIRADDVNQGVVILQVLTPSKRPSPASLGVSGHPAPRSGRPGRRLVSEVQFACAVRLLRLTVHDVAETGLAEVERSDLERAQRRVRAYQKEETRLRRQLRRRLPAVRETPAATEAETHAQQLVHRILDHVHQHYDQPLALKELATVIGLNAAYLSDLFTRTVGLSFRKYLAAVRLDKAKELLSDPTKQIAEVAYSVGYTDANQFRRAFKHWTGLAPAAWRSCLRTP